MVGHGGSSAVSYLADPTSPNPSHCASVVAISTVRVSCELPLLDTDTGSHFPKGIRDEGRHDKVITEMNFPQS